MSATKLSKKSTGAIRKWIVTIWVMFLSLCSLFSAYVCLGGGLTKSTKPFVGGAFCLFGAFMLITYYVLEWRKGRDISIKLILEASQLNGTIVVKEPIAVHIIKWIISIYTCLYAGLSAVATLICIFFPPDNTAYPEASLLYLSSGGIVIGALVFTVWEKWSAP